MLKIGLLFLAVCGVTELAASEFPCDPGCPLTGSASQMIHTAIAVVFYGSLGIFPLLIGLGLRQDTDWQRYSAYSVVTGITTVALFVAFSIAVVDSFQYLGLINRLLLSLPFLWIEVMGMGLLSIFRGGDLESSRF